jgi:hypothetical protein
MAGRPEVSFFLANGGGHRNFFPVQNPAWDFQLDLPDYEPGRPFGFRGRICYAPWRGQADVVSRYKSFRGELG